jgi:cyclopropane fatty-acyl-phospholipid synthase-like methyltransferase
MPYEPDHQFPGFWFYNGLRIQADVAAHQFVLGHVTRHLSVGSDILDIATGEGALAQQLLDQGFQVSCTSWNNRARVQAPVYSVNLDYPFSVEEVGKRQYPLISAIEIIEHLENPALFLRCLRKVLAPGGQLILSTPNVESAQARLQWFIRGCPAIFSEGEVRENRHISMLWRVGLETLFDWNGWTIVEKHLVGSFQLPSNPVIALSKYLLYQVMEYILPGELQGTTRIYVLKASESDPIENTVDLVF